jgi:murein DD-endopeptidase MepM/ murein hydrolase activator NlpD
MTILSVLPVLTEGTTYRVTSPFGYRTDPVTGAETEHKGIDLTLWRGYSALSAIGAAWDGTVTDVRDGVEGFDTVRSAGNRVTIDHGDGVVTKYYHLANGSIPVQVGDSVAAGQVIGQMGSTGYSTGAHLHFQLEIYGEVVDPLPFLLGEEDIPEEIPAEEMDNIPAEWAEEAVAWAVENGILYGDENGNYRLHENCTREMMLVFLYRAVGGGS